MGELRVHQGTRAQRTLSEININILYLHAILCTLMLGLGWRDGITKGVQSYDGSIFFQLAIITCTIVCTI